MCVGARLREFRLYLLKLKRKWLIFANDMKHRKAEKEKERESSKLYKECWKAAVRANLIEHDCICRLTSSGHFKYFMDCVDCPYCEKQMMSRDE